MMDTLNATDRDDYPERPPGHRLWLTVPTGLLAAAGGGCVAAGIFQRYATGIESVRHTAVLPDWRLYLGLAAAVGVCGLAALVTGRTVLARTAVGVLAVPAVLLAALIAGAAIVALNPLVQANGVRAIGLGAWLMMGGAAAGLAAALLVLAQTGGYAAAGFGSLAPTLAALGAIGLVYSWVAGVAGRAGEPPLRSGYLALLTSLDHSGAATLAMVGGLGLAAAAVGIASGRRGAPAAGVALGAAVAVGVDLGVRLTTVQRMLDADSGLERRDETLIALGATVLALLLLAVSLRGRRVPEDDFEPAGHPLGYESSPGREPRFEPAPGTPGFGGPPYEGPYDSPYDRPYDPQPRYDRPPERPGNYLPEHDPAPGARYPLVPDERAAQHPSPPRPGIGRPED
jgi:hypothetical protein